MNFAHYTKHVRILVVAAVLGLAACTQGFSANPTQSGGAAPSYERIIARFENPADLSFQESGAFAHFVPGDVIRVRYRLAADERGRERPVRDGDVLQLDIYDRSDLSLRRVAVGTDGEISLPLLGRVQAAGETLEELSIRVGFLYRLGGVQSPSVIFSLVSAGAAPPLATSETIEEVAVSDDLQIDLPHIALVDADREPDRVWDDIRRAYRHRFGDELDIVVSRSRVAPRNVYVVGEVRHAGRVPLGRRMSAMRAVAAAGGLGSTADATRLVLMRLMPDKIFRYWTFSLGDGRAARGSRYASVRLLPNDVVLVPQAGTDEINVSIAEATSSTMPKELRRELGLLGLPLTRREPPSRGLSCVPDIETRNWDLGNALTTQLRSPVFSNNYIWTMQEFFEEQRYAEAELLAAESLSLREKVLGQNNLPVAQGLNTLGLTYDVQGRYADAKELYARALLIQEELLGSFHPFVASTIENLAYAYIAECRYSEARALHQRVIAIRKAVQGPGHPDLTRSLVSYADFEERVVAVEASD